MLRWPRSGAHEHRPMIDHVSIPVADLTRAAAFYDDVLAAVGMVQRKHRAGAIGYGPAVRTAPVFWLLQRAGDE